MSRRTAVVIAALAVAVGVLPLLRGFPGGQDWLYELVRVAEFRHALVEGQLPPFRAPNLYGGLGSPIFLFYAPLFAATAAAFSVVTGSIAWQDETAPAPCRTPLLSPTTDAALFAQTLETMRRNNVFGVLGG